MIGLKFRHEICSGVKLCFKKKKKKRKLLLIHPNIYTRH